MSRLRSSDRAAFIESAFEASFDLKAVTSFDGSVLDANRAALEVAHLGYDELLGRNFWDTPGLTAHPEIAEWLRQAVGEAATGTVPKRDVCLLRADGTEVYYEMSVRAFAPTERSGRFVLIQGRDITARHRHRVALEASEARHRELFESNGAIQLLADAEDARIIDVNPAAEAFYGWPRETMRTMLATDLESSTLEEWRAVGDTIAVGTGRSRRREHRVANNARRHVDTFTSVVRVAGRRVVHVIIQDVSDRVRAEELARESEARYRAVILSMHEGVVVHDHTGAIRAVNPSAERILGHSSAQLLGIEPIGEALTPVHADGTAWPQDQHPALVALRTGEIQPLALMGITRRDGVPTWLSVSAAPLMRAGETKAYGAVAVFSDITDERVAADRLRQAQKLEAVGQLAGGIAHDFNNLLTVIRGAVGFLAEGLGHDSPHLEDVQAIERATVRAEELTSRLLAVGRRQMLQRTGIDLSELLRLHHVAVRNTVPMSIAVRMELATEPTVALLDRTRVHDAIRALVDNATNAMPNGGTLTLGTAIVTRDGPAASGFPSTARRFVVLRVSDTGVGMPDDVKARLFEPFFSTQPFGTGRGMELASVHGMVAQSNGFIECESEPGHGTTLRLFFPEAAPSAEAVVPHTRSGTPVASRGVLLVDDDPMLRDLARRMLEKLGHRILVAASGREALSVLESRRSEIAIIVTDLTMPGMSGMELIDEVQRSGVELPIVAMSGFALNSMVRDELAARQIPFVAKPFTAAELTQTIDRAMQPAVK